MGKTTKAISEEIMAIYAEFYRHQSQTFLTVAEWKTVTTSGKYAEFLKEGKPFYRFSHFGETRRLWKAFNASRKAAKQHGDLSSDYMMMVLFVVIFSSIENVVKGIVSLPLSLFMKKENNTVFQSHVAASFDDYAKFIHHTPFYKYPYFSKLKQLAKNFWKSPEKTFADYVTFFYMALEFIARGTLSLPVSHGYGDGKAPQIEKEKISLIVKKYFFSENSPNTIENTENFKKGLSDIEGVELVTGHGKDGVYSRQAEKRGGIVDYRYAHVRIPRFSDCLPVLEQLIKEGYDVPLIAGNPRIVIEGVANTEAKNDRQAIAKQVEERSEAKCFTSIKEYGGTTFFFHVKTKYLKKFMDATDNLVIDNQKNQVGRRIGFSRTLAHDY